MPVFVVERFLPALSGDGVVAQARQERDLRGVKYLRTTCLRDDELCFSVFEAPSLAAVKRANDLAGMAYERVSEAIDVSREVPGPVTGRRHRGGRGVQTSTD